MNGMRTIGKSARGETRVERENPQPRIVVHKDEWPRIELGLQRSDTGQSVMHLAGDGGSRRHAVAVERPVRRRIGQQPGGDRGRLAISIERIDDQQPIERRYRTAAIRIHRSPGGQSAGRGGSRPVPPPIRLRFNSLITVSASNGVTTPLSETSSRLRGFCRSAASSTRPSRFSNSSRRLWLDVEDRFLACHSGRNVARRHPALDDCLDAMTNSPWISASLGRGSSQKTDADKHPEGFIHVGLLVLKPPRRTGMLIVESANHGNVAERRSIRSAFDPLRGFVGG